MRLPAAVFGIWYFVFRVLYLVALRGRRIPRVRPAKHETQNTKQEGGGPVPETWRMMPRGSDQAVLVVNPHLTADQITEVSQQLSAILAEEI